MLKQEIGLFLGMGATKTVSRKHNQCGNFVRSKKYMLAKLFICTPLVIFHSCFIKSFVFRRTSASKSLHENRLVLSLLFKIGKQPLELGSFRK